jgi:catechol 2,3-dioxygenase
MQAESGGAVGPGIHPATRVGKVSLTVADLDRQIAFCQEVLRMRLHWRDEGRAGLGAGGEDLVHLLRKPGARRPPRTTGLYHYAILVPDRRELARAIARLMELRYPNHPTDHIMTKTTYLRDPEGQEIEIYTESPEDGYFGFAEGSFVARRADGTPSDGREPLDLDALFRELGDGSRLDDPLPPATRLGHVHLYVSHLQAAVDFYHGVLGFDVMGVAHDWGAAFVSAGGYHHHVGLNTWMGVGAPRAPEGSAGMRDFTVVLPGEAERERVLERVRRAGLAVENTAEGPRLLDPSGNGLVLLVEGAVG